MAKNKPKKLQKITLDGGWNLGYKGFIFCRKYYYHCYIFEFFILIFLTFFKVLLRKMDFNFLWWFFLFFHLPLWFLWSCKFMPFYRPSFPILNRNSWYLPDKGQNRFDPIRVKITKFDGKISLESLQEYKITTHNLKSHFTDQLASQI